MMNIIYRQLILFLLISSLPFPLLHSATSNNPNGDFLVLNIPDGDCTGFFAIFSAVLSVLDTYDQGNCAGVKIDLNRGLYHDPERGPNWWDYYFEPIELGEINANVHVLTKAEVLHHTGVGFHIPRMRAHKLIEKYTRLKPELRQEIDSFIKKHEKHVLIGVHHRGTDKILESPLVPYAKTLDALNSILRRLPSKLIKKIRIYIATDTQDFLEYMQSIYPEQIIYSNFVRSRDSTALHVSSFYMNNYQKGKEALLDCLFLSRCGCLIYPASSSFSRACLFFNPELKAIPLK